MKARFVFLGLTIVVLGLLFAGLAYYHFLDDGDEFKSKYTSFHYEIYNDNFALKNFCVQTKMQLAKKSDVDKFLSAKNLQALANDVFGAKKDAKTCVKIFLRENDFSNPNKKYDICKIYTASIDLEVHHEGEIIFRSYSELLANNKEGVKKHLNKLFAFAKKKLG